MYQWVESISSSSSLDPSPMLLNTSEGAVIQTGFMFVQEFAHAVPSAGEGEKSQSPKLVGQRRLGNDTTYAGTYSAVDYGEHWTVLRSSGLVQCLVKGKPETLFHLSDCRVVKVHNPKEMKEGAVYSIQVDTPESVLVLKAALPTEHSDWVLSIEQMLQKLDRHKLIEGHRKRESGYVALKRLLMAGTGSSLGQGFSFSSPLYCLPKISDDMDDLYEAPKASPSQSGGGQQRGAKHSKLLQKCTSLTQSEQAVEEQCEEERSNDENSGLLLPLPPPPPPSRADGPPPLPPRSEEHPPPLPPKGISRPISVSPRASTASVGSGSEPDPDDDYVMMQTSSQHSSVPPSPSGSARFVSPCRKQSASQTQPITIPNHRRLSKRSALLRKDSDSSSCAPSPTGSMMKSLQEGTELVLGSIPRGSSSSSFSLQRQQSNQSLGSVSSSYLNSVTSDTPPSLPPKNERKSSGFCSPSALANRSPSIYRSQSCIQRPFPAMTSFSFSNADDTSKSDGITMAEANHLKQQYEAQRHHPVSRAESALRIASLTSEGYASNQSSCESLVDVSIIHVMILTKTAFNGGWCMSVCILFIASSWMGARLLGEQLQVFFLQCYNRREYLEPSGCLAAATGT